MRRHGDTGARRRSDAGRGPAAARRRRGTPWVSGACLGLLAGCLQLGTFPCERDSQCELDGRQGQCVAPGYCALPDDRCESGYRYHERSVPEDLAGQCTPPPADDGVGSSTSGMGGSSSTAGTSSSSDAGSSSSSSGASSSSDEGSSSTGSACGDHPCPCTQSLAVGLNHTCAVRTDGRVLCWGANNQGQLGMGTGTGPIPEPQVVVIPGEELATAVISSNNHVCARGQDDALWCWGENNNGEITTPSNMPPSVVGPTALPLLQPPGAVGLSSHHSCVGDPLGPGVRCLGNNGYGELGGSGTQPIDGAVPGMAAVDELAVGTDHSCARAGGQVWCWGRDNSGQLGQNMVPGPTPDPVAVTLPGPASHLAAGNNHTCAAFDEGTAVRCWGRGDLGQIGDGTTNNRQLPTALAMSLAAPVVAMDAMADTTCVLLDDGSLWCWGDDNGIPLGTDIGAADPMLVPMQVLVVDELPEPIVEFGLGVGHLCARAETGRLWCWGRDTLWQLGPDDPPMGQRAVELDLGCPAG